MKPLITILLPCYNVEKFIPRCLDSIISQTYKNLQIIAIDDGSNDKTWCIMQEYAQKDTRIEIYHQKNQGVSSTRNNLLDKVKGDYVLFIDSDDWCEHNMLEFLVHKIIDNNADVAICSDVVNDRIVKTEYNEYILDKKNTIKQFLLHKKLRGSLCNKLFKASLLHKLKFNNNVSYGEDALFCWHLFQRINRVYFSTRELYHYRMNENSISHSSFNSLKLSGHFVWNQICTETKIMHPEFLLIAQARHCIEDVLLLRDAAHSNYKKKDDIELLQNTIKKLRHTLYKIDITSNKMKLYALISSYSYWLASKI